MKTKIEKQNNKLKFVTLRPKLSRQQLFKDFGLIPYIMYKYFEYDSRIAVYEEKKRLHTIKEVNGLKFEYLKNTGDLELDGYNYLVQNAKNIDILQLYSYNRRSLNWINIYKKKNPKGKIYLKLDVSSHAVNKYYKFNEKNINIIKQCDLISAETKQVCKYLNKKFPFNIEYIPNGFHTHDYFKKTYVKYEEKENIIITVGRIGLYVKATEILMQAFAKASKNLKDWKLKIIGPIINHEFIQYKEKYFNENPELKDRVIFTGSILDRTELNKEYQKSKIFCLTSRWESFGIVLAEALSKGCYIITSNVDSANDITDNGKYGDIFEVDNVEQLTEYLIKACNNEERRKKVCFQAQDYAYDKFNWVKTCAKIDKLLHAK